MQERQTASKPEIAAQKKVVKFAPAIGDWTTYKPPKVLVKKVKTGLYGFDRLSVEELDLALLIHYRFIQKLFKRFKIELHMAVEMLSVQVQQTTYLNFLRSINESVVQAKLMIDGMHEPIPIFFSQPAANSIINYALGSQDLEPIERSLTEAEDKVLTTVITEYLPDYTEAFNSIFDQPTFSIISSPEVSLDASVNTSSTFVYFTVEAALADNIAGKISIGYLGSALKNLLAKYQQKDAEKQLDFSVLPPALLSELKIPLNVTLGTSFLSTGEISGIEEGDVVPLDSPINTPTPLTVAEALKVYCQPGFFNKKLSVRVTAFKDTSQLEVPPPSLEKPKEKAPLPPPPPPPEEKKILPEPAPAKAAPQPAAKAPPPPKKGGFLEEFEDEEFTEDALGEEGFEDEFLDDEPTEEELAEEEGREEKL